MLKNTKLRSSLSVNMLQRILRSNEFFPSPFDVDERLKALHGNAGSSYMSRFCEVECTRFDLAENFE